MKKLNFTRRDAIYIAIIGVLLIGLVAAIVLPRALEKSGGTLYPEYYNSKCDSYEVQNANLSQGQIVFIGDSITDLYHLDDYYADLDLAVYNRGIGGDTTGGVLNRLAVSVTDLAPSIVVLMIGTNDVNGIEPVDTIARRYERILDRLRTALPDTEIYCMSVIPQNEDVESYSTVVVKNSIARIHELNGRITALSADYGATYLDLYPLLADENDRLKREYSDDGIHLNARGFEIWTALLKPYLQ